MPKAAGSSVTNWLTGFTFWNEIELGSTRYGACPQRIPEASSRC